jgi:hypothetical protein
MILKLSSIVIMNGPPMFHLFIIKGVLSGLAMATGSASARLRGLLTRRFRFPVAGAGSVCFRVRRFFIGMVQRLPANLQHSEPVVRRAFEISLREPPKCFGRCYRRAI